MRKLFLAAILVAGLAACTPGQVRQAQVDQALIQTVLDTACTDNALEAVIASAVPEVTLACVGGKMSAAVVTAVINDPALVAKVEAAAKKSK